MSQESCSSRMSEESSSPKSSQESSSDYYKSPSKKARLSWDYWSKDKPHEHNSTMSNVKTLQITNLTYGNYSKGRLIFRVALKTSLKTRKNSTVFNFNAIDESGEIRCTVYGEHAARFFDQVQINGVYSVEDFYVGASNKTFSGLDNELEISINTGTRITPCNENTKEIEFSFTPIEMVKSYEDAKAKIDILGIMVKDWGAEVVKAKTKRDITLTDSSKTGIIATIWGEEAADFQADIYSPLAIKRANINEYDGVRSISCGFGTLIWVNPVLTAAKELSDWFENNKSQASEEV